MKIISTPTKCQGKLGEEQAMFFRDKPLLIINIHAIIIMIMFGVVFTTGRSNGETFSKDKKIVVLDPGHGGHDNGARGPEGIMEKAVTLSLARRIVAELEDVCKVVLTRTDDYGMKIFERTATANHLKADLFISLHTGGSFLHKTSGISIFYFDEMPNTDQGRRPTLSKPDKNIPAPIAWNTIQIKHKKTSQALAETIREHLRGRTGSLKRPVQTARLMVLEGADMPAVLIEIGYLTNPAKEKKLADPDYLSDLAKDIRNGVIDFFNKDPGT